MRAEPTSGRRRGPPSSESAARAADIGTRARTETPLEQACDRLCRLAARLLDLPAVLVTLRDEDRPFLVGIHGLADARRWWGASPLSIALLDHTGVDGEPLSIPDVETHELLADDPLHTEAGFHAFLALPLRVGGEALGSMCALSHEPREWSRDDLELLELVASSVLTELRALHADGRTVWMEELALLSNRAASIQEPFELTVRRLSEHIGWAVGHALFRRESDPDELLSTSIWFLADPERQQPFQASTDDMRFPRGEDLPGRVLESAEPLWITRLSEDPDFPRKDAAAQAGLSSAVAFPVLAGSEVAAVLEFFSAVEVEPTPEVLELMEHVGALLGRVVERKRAERAIRQTEARTRRIVETAHEAFVSIDEEGVVQEWNAEAERTFGWKREEVVGRELASFLLPGRYRDDHRRGIARFLENGEGPILGKRLELEALTRNRGEIPVELTVSPLRVERSWTFNAFLRDISERRRQERERMRRERLLAHAQRLARVGSWEWDIVRDEVTWSEELHRLFQTDPETFRPDFRAYLERLPTEDRELARALVQHSLETGEEFMFEHRVVRPDGSERVLLGQGSVEKDADGRPARMIGTAQDITERKELEDRSRQLAAEQAARSEAEAGEKRITAILESIAGAFLHVDPEWRFTYVNSEGERMLRRSAADLAGTSFWEAIDGGTRSSLRLRLEGAIERQRPADFEVYDEGRSAWFEVHAFPSEGGLSIYLHDISARKDAEAGVRASEARYRFLSDAIPQQVWTALPDGRLEYVNRVVLDYTGLEAEAMVGRLWEEWVHPDDLQEVRRRWDASCRRARDFEMELRLRDSGGSFRWHLARAKGERSADGEILRWYGTNTNVDDLKELEEARDRALSDLERVTHLLSSERTTLEEHAKELRKTALALQRSNQELDQFAYVASHDLKAPLRGIANLAQWLAEDLEGKLDAQSRQYLELLMGRVRRMEGLIEGILHYSRAGRRIEEPETVDVGRLVEEVVDMLAPPEDFDIRVEGYMPVLVSERAPLEQVFLNLVGNALKHAGGEAPCVTVAVTDEGGGWYEFSVSDNGPGISPEYHDKIFTIFQTLKRKDEQESTGIGLSVVKRIVERRGGQVWVESEEGAGATFRFLWPEQARGGKDSFVWTIER